MCKNLAHLKFRIVKNNKNLKNIFNMQKTCILKFYNHENYEKNISVGTNAVPTGLVKFFYKNLKKFFQ